MISGKIIKKTDFNTKKMMKAANAFFLQFSQKRNMTLHSNEVLLKINPKLTESEQLASVGKIVLGIKEYHAKLPNFNCKIHVYRGENEKRTVHEVEKAKGFLAKGIKGIMENEDSEAKIEEHAETTIKKHVDGATNSYYVSTTRRESVARDKFSGARGTVYLVIVPEIYSPIFQLHHTALIGNTATVHEHEIAAMGFIPFSNIMSWYNRCSGQIQINKAFLDRSYSIEVTSANMEEHSASFKLNQDKILENPLISRGFLSSDVDMINDAKYHFRQIDFDGRHYIQAPVRSICYPEAVLIKNSIKSELDDSIKRGPHQFIINSIPSNVECPTKKGNYDEKAIASNKGFKFSLRLYNEIFYQLNKPNDKSNDKHHGCDLPKIKK